MPVEVKFIFLLNVSERIKGLSSGAVFYVFSRYLEPKEFLLKLLVSPRP